MRGTRPGRRIREKGREGDKAVWINSKKRRISGGQKGLSFHAGWLSTSS